MPANRTCKSWSKKKNVVFNTFDKILMPRENKGIIEGSQKSILGKSTYTFQKKLSPKEVDEHMAQNLCFFCHDKLFPGHDFPQRKKCKFSLWKLGRKTIWTQPRLILFLRECLMILLIVLSLRFPLMPFRETLLILR